MLQESFPGGFTPLNAADLTDMLVAGCGTGSQVVDLAASIEKIRLTAVDLSLASLAYAKRKTPAQFAVEYGQADILRLGALGRSFDVITASGVLHHMAKPFEAWKSLLPLLRDDGLMLVGLYSRLARTEINQARAYAADRGYQATPEGIRGCRGELAAKFSGLSQIGDFYSVSGCRDLLFHVEEHQFALPEIKDFIAANGLRFVGFLFDPPQRDAYARFFREAGWSMTDLDHWHAFEQRNPRTFAAMYQFWVQKT
jgi:ubiquinone/menaquinone biosynthesis C-methylase UbiE